jgi:ketosteroid isomerase-like protein
MTVYPREEIEATIAEYVALREQIDAKNGKWSDLARFFTDDAVFIDPAWGRVQGIEEMKRTVFGDAMVGLDDWKFPTEFYAISGNNVVIKWQQVLPGRHADGRPYVQSGYSTLIYAGDGKFCYEEDLLNMTHVFEDLKASGWTAPPGMGMPPKHPDRDFSRPAGAPA